MSNNLIKLAPLVKLDRLYTVGLLQSSSETSRGFLPSQQQVKEVVSRINTRTTSTNTEVMLLQKWNAKQLADSFELPALEVELERAVEQVENSIKAKSESQEKAQVTTVAQDSETAQANHTPRR